MSMKTCPQCSVLKPRSSFNKSSRNKDGLQSWCRDCQKKDYSDNRELRLEQNYKWVEENRNKAKSYKDKYRNSPKGRQKSQEYRDGLDKEELAKFSKKYREENKDSLKAQNLEYYTKNRDEILEQKRRHREKPGYKELP